MGFCKNCQGYTLCSGYRFSPHRAHEKIHEIKRNEMKTKVYEIKQSRDKTEIGKEIIR